MPNFRKLTPSDIQELTRRRNNSEDLAEYLSYLQTLKPGDWGSIELSGDDSQRTVKRRTSIAATAQGKKLKWRRATPSNSLVFEILKPK